MVRDRSLIVWLNEVIFHTLFLDKRKCSQLRKYTKYTKEVHTNSCTILSVELICRGMGDIVTVISPNPKIIPTK